MRTVNKDNPKNIKCEHCMFFERADYPQYDFGDDKDWCCLHQANKHYWNRCEEFEWDKKYER